MSEPIPLHKVSDLHREIAALREDRKRLTDALVAQTRELYEQNKKLRASLVGVRSTMLLLVAKIDDVLK